jgi:hypothetical protein
VPVRDECLSAPRRRGSPARPRNPSTLRRQSLSGDGFPHALEEPHPPSQILSQSYDSSLPTSLTYILPCTRGCSPWRPDAVSSTLGGWALPPRGGGTKPNVSRTKTSAPHSSTREEPCPLPTAASRSNSIPRAGEEVRAKRGLAWELVLAWSGPLASPRRAHAPVPESSPDALSGEASHTRKEA